jgi:hypothetical protein
MASAAYWIGSAADAVFIGASTDAVGSIGVAACSTSTTRAARRCRASRSPTSTPASTSASRARTRRSPKRGAPAAGAVDYFYSLFVDAVARIAASSSEQVLSNMADGRIFIGQQAIQAGLVDGASTLDALVAELASGRYARRARPPVLRPARGAVRTCSMEAWMRAAPVLRRVSKPQPEEEQDDGPERAQGEASRARQGAHRRGLRAGKQDAEGARPSASSPSRRRRCPGTSPDHHAEGRRQDDRPGSRGADLAAEKAKKGGQRSSAARDAPAPAPAAASASGEHAERTPKPPCRSRSARRRSSSATRRSGRVRHGRALHRLAEARGAQGSPNCPRVSPIQTRKNSDEEETLALASPPAWRSPWPWAQAQKRSEARGLQATSAAGVQCRTCLATPVEAVAAPALKVSLVDLEVQASRRVISSDRGAGALFGGGGVSARHDDVGGRPLAQLGARRLQRPRRWSPPTSSTKARRSGTTAPTPTGRSPPATASSALPRRRWTTRPARPARRTCACARKGRVQLPITSFDVTDVGKPVFASDDDTFTLTQSTNSHVGKAVRFVATGTVIVEFDAHRAGAGPRHRAHRQLGRHGERHAGRSRGDLRAGDGGEQLRRPRGEGERAPAPGQGLSGPIPQEKGEKHECTRTGQPRHHRRVLRCPRGGRRRELGAARFQHLRLRPGDRDLQVARPVAGAARVARRPHRQDASARAASRSRTSTSRRRWKCWSPRCGATRPAR